MLRRAAAAALLAAAAGCFGGSAGPKPAALEPLEGAKAPRILWRASIGGAGEFALRPALAGGDVFAAARDGTVARFSGADGREAWRAVLDVRLSAGVGADARTIVVATDEGEVLALEAESGKLRWRTRVSSEVLAAPLVSGELVVVRSADSRIHALAAADGKRRWLYQRTPAALRLRTAQGLSMREDLIYAGFSGGKLVALQRSNGALRWEGTVAVPRGATELERVADVVGDPALVGREACAAAFQGRAACFDAESGSQLWARELSSATGVSADARYAFVSDERGAVHALDRSNGRSLWRQERLANRQLTLPLPHGASVVVADLEGYVHLLARDSGTIVARAATDGSAVRAAPLALADGFLVQTSAGSLTALAY